MLKYPSVAATKGKASKVLISSRKPSKSWYGKIKTNTLGTLYGSQEQRYVLKWKEFMCIAFMWETPLFHMLYYLDLVIRYGGIFTFLSYLVFAMAVALPLVVVQLIFGTYTKRGYIRLWDMVPMLKGMAWSVSTFSIVLEFFNVALAGLALTYVSDLFSPEIPWSNCSFTEASNACYPMYPNKWYDEQCCEYDCTQEQLLHVIHFPAYDYLLKHKMKTPDSYERYEGIGTIQVPWVIGVGCTWFLIFLFLTAGLQKFRAIITTIALVFGMLFFVPTVGLTFVSSYLPLPVVMYSNVMNVFTGEFWLSILTHSFSRKTPGNYVVLGSCTPQNFLPNVQVFCLYAMKFVCFLCLMIWLSTCVQLVQRFYMVKDVRCIPINGLTFVFALIPELLSQAPVPQVPLVVYFLGLWFYGFSTALFTLMAFVESLVEVVPAILGVRVYFCAILCSLCCSLNVLLLTNLYLAIVETWRDLCFTIISVTLAFLFSITIFLYSVRRIASDFDFTFGQSIIGTYWMHSLKFMSFIACYALALILFVNLDYKPDYYSSLLIRVLCYIFIAVVLVPVIIIAIWVYLKQKNINKGRAATTPAIHWGPPSGQKKQARSKFNPQREIRYKKEDQRCRHNCLLGSHKVKIEIRMLQLNRWRLTDSIAGDHSDEHLLPD